MTEYVIFPKNKKMVFAMRVMKQMSRMLLIYLFVLVLVIAIVFLPRGGKIPLYMMDIVYPDGSTMSVPYPFSEYKYYTFDFHWNAIKSFFVNWFQTGSMGVTRFNVTVETELWLSAKLSLPVIAASFLISFCFGVAKGFFDFKMQRKRLSLFGHSTTWLFQAIPDYVIILLVQGVLGIFLSHRWEDIGFGIFRYVNKGLDWFVLIGEHHKEIYYGKFGFVFFPALCIIFVIITFNVLGEGLRRHFDRKKFQYM